MKTFGTGMPPRNPKAVAEAAARQHLRNVIHHHLRLQLKSTADGVLECLRIAGVVLVVIDLAGLFDASFTLAFTLVFAPQLFGTGVLVSLLAWRRWVRWRVSRAVR